MPIAFRSVHPDFRSSRGFVWPFPGGVAEAVGPFTDRPGDGCPAHKGDGICLALNMASMASGGIPAITVLVCEYEEADLLGTEPDGSKIRVKQAKVLRVVDFPASLRGAVPVDADLPSGAYLSGADLRSANLYGADLSSADLSGADLSSANLRSANLSSADLSSANLSGADLRSANLSSANLRSAHLSGANLSGADLSGANLSYAPGDKATTLPAGYSVRDGLIVKG